MGEITILPGHVPLVATLKSGELKAKAGNEEHFIYVAGGFVEVKPDSKVIVLADAAEHHYEINVKAAEEAKARAEAAMKDQKLSGQEFAQVAAALEKSLARLNIARKHSHRRNPLSGQGTLSE